MCFEEFESGQRFQSTGRTVTETEIIAFAPMYDPQTMHLDAEWAANGPFSGLIASGFLTLSIAWWLFLQLGLVRDSIYLGLGLEDLRWTRPVRPGDTVTLAVVVHSKGEERKGRGLVTFAHRLQNQSGETVMTYLSLNLIRLQPTP